MRRFESIVKTVVCVLYTSVEIYCWQCTLDFGRAPLLTDLLPGGAAYTASAPLTLWFIWSACKRSDVLLVTLHDCLNTIVTLYIIR